MPASSGVELRAAALPCPQCAGAFAIKDHRTTGAGIRAVDVRCRQCGVARTLWFSGWSPPSRIRYATLVIRAARDGDFETIAAITNHYIATTAIHFAYEPVPVAEFAELWRDTHARFPWLVTEDDRGSVIGYAKAGTWRSRAAYAWTTEVGLYVADGARGRGLGTALYAALLDEVAARGFRSAVAGVTLPNDASIALHRRFGFEPTGVVREAGWKFGAWHDVAWFQKMFGGGGPA